MSQTSAQISVIIPAYNQGHYLAKAVKSVLAQTYTAWEAIIVDDGSTDDTAEVAATFSDPRIRYIYQENRGLSGARNTGIRHARGNYLTYLDSDDCFVPEKLALLVTELEDKPHLGFVAGQAIPVDERGCQIGKTFKEGPPEDPVRWLLGNPLHVGSVLVRRSWQERVGFFDERLRSYEDWDMWLRLARAGCQMGWVPRPVSLYRFHTGQMTRDGRQMTEATLAVLDKFFKDDSLPESWRAMEDTAYSRAYLRAAAQAYREEDLASARDHLSQAVSLDPELTADGGAALAAHVAAWTDLPKISDPVAYMERVCNNLPDRVEGLRSRLRSELGRVALQQAFAAYGEREMACTRAAVRQAIRYHPRWLANRGVLSILVRSHLPWLAESGASTNHLEQAKGG